MFINKFRKCANLIRKSAKEIEQATKNHKELFVRRNMERSSYSHPNDYDYNDNDYRALLNLGESSVSGINTVKAGVLTVFHWNKIKPQKIHDTQIVRAIFKSKSPMS